MEPDDIGVVMARASELHASICDAIGRVAQSRVVGNGSSSLHSFGEEEEEQHEHEVEDEDEDEEEVSEAAAAGKSSSSTEEEVRSLESIREALEMLETQLESLQSVQQQQRLRKDAALAELEESRRVLLLRLREHDGREMQVVEEAMTFAGEPVRKTDDLPLPPYLLPVSPSVYCESPVFRSAKPSLAKQLDGRCAFNSSLFHVSETASETEVANSTVSSVATEQATSPPSGGFPRAFTGVLSFTGKTLLVVVSVVACLAVSELHLNSRGRKSLPKAKPPRSSTPIPIPVEAKPPEREPKAMPVLECPAGYKRIEDGGIVKCIVKERVELPFPRGLKTPDVLHGRG